MKKIVLSVLCIAIAASANAKYRDFQDQEGRTIRGRVISFDAGSQKVKIERDTKKTVTVPVSIFSDADQAYFKEWGASQGFSSSALFKISCDDKQLNKRKVKDTQDITYQGGSVEEDFVKTVTTFENIAYEFKFQNSNKSELKDIRMEYVIYYEQSKMVWEKKPELKQLYLYKEANISPLPAKSSSTFVTKPVEIHTDNVNPIPQAGGDQRRGGSGDVHGIRARFYLKMASGEEIMREFSHPSSLSDKKFPWKDEPMPED